MNNAYKQSGSTLIMGMIILILLMLLGVTSMVISDTQFKLASNLQFEDTAMNNTETAVNAAETFLATGTNFNDGGFTTYNSTGRHELYPTGTAPDPLTLTWSDSNSLQVANTDQRYFIELMHTGDHLAGSSEVIGVHASTGCLQVNTYQITARGAYFRGSIKFVQSFYSVLSCLP